MEIEGPRIVTPADPKKHRRPGLSGAAAEVANAVARTPAGAAQPSTKPPQPANDDGPRRSAIVTVRDRKPVQRQREQQQMAKLMQDDELKRSAIVTARKPAKAIPDGLLPDTPEEHKRRGDAADAMFQEIKRKIAAR